MQSSTYSVDWLSLKISLFKEFISLPGPYLNSRCQQQLRKIRICYI